ncbi:DUF1045 domain-containing protein [Streptomyces sp. NPDC059080]|uniref:DUF1045 domain-containing protein n=1 Tax=Streptomyces sp. NPDC059080 TaxID=3346718 RepID=UPI0036A5AEFB
MTQLEKMRWILFYVFITLFVLIVGSTVWAIFFSLNGWNPQDKNLITKIFVGEVGISVIALFYGLFNLKNAQNREALAAGDTGTEANAIDAFYIKTHPRSQHPNFFSEVEELIPKSKNITLIAVGLNLLWEKHIADMLIRRAQEGTCHVTVCMGNTASPHVEDRFIEEEMEWNRPQVGRSGIDRNIRALVERLHVSGNPKNFKFVLFEHYPTFATLIFDDDLFIYPYGYQSLGNVSPIFHVRNDGSDQANFFLENARKIVSDSIPANDLISVRKNRRFRSDNWILAAVYIIPSRDSSIYQFGSSVLGYDIYHAQPVPAPQNLAFARDCVGESAEYGFHATLADALYYSSEQQIERVRAEVRFLSQEFKPFHLDRLEPAVSPHDSRAVIIRAQDSSGTVESIHHELVSRVYRTAVSSTYLAGQTTKALPAGDHRAQMMLERYGSPFVLDNFMLHFTVCGSCPEGATSRIVDSIQQQMDGILQEKIYVDHIALVTKRPGQRKWVIEETFPLCGPRWS